ncbi:MAG: L,D-transpeptidase [Gaiellales bacterium]
MIAAGVLLAVIFGAPAHAAESPRFPASGTVIVSRAAVHAEPSGASPVLQRLTPLDEAFNRRVVLAIARRTDADGAAWLQLRLPGRPNGGTGWVRESAVAVEPVRFGIVVWRRARVLEVYDRTRPQRPVMHAAIAVGAPGMETPLGEYFITGEFRPDPDTQGVLGAWAWSTSSYSKLSDWPGGGVVGIHGTSEPELLGQAVSHGCIRVDDRNVAKMRRWIGPGATVSIRR